MSNRNLQFAPTGHRPVTRRAALGLLAGVLAAPALAQGLVPVRLLVVRQPARIPQTECLAPCIRGHIYDLSGGEALEDAVLRQVVLAGLGALAPVCDVIERPWADNKANVSSIPRGVYLARIREEPTKDWMTTLDRRWRIELEGVRHRSNIQFHYGKDEKWSEGCFIVGRHRETGNYCGLDDPEGAIAALRAAVAAPGRDAGDIRVGVTDYENLMPTFARQAGCG